MPVFSSLTEEQLSAAINPIRFSRVNGPGADGGLGGNPGGVLGGVLGGLRIPGGLGGVLGIAATPVV